jgi:gluconolactonase
MKHLKSKLVFIVIFVACHTAFSQSYLLIKDAKIKKIVPEDAVIEKIGGGFQFTEGPVWSPEGFLLFTDIPANRIYKWSPGGQQVEVYMEPTGNANGLMFDGDGNLILCQHSERQIGRDNNTGGFETICDNFEGKRFNSPNDLDIRSDGIIYFTDPPYGLKEGANDPAKELPYQGVFMYKDGKAYLLDKTLSMPNGIALSPDEKYLYVADHNRETGEKQWFQYTVNKDGTVKGRKLFADASKSTEQGGPDGMAVDADGNLYVTGPGGVLIYDPSGTWLGLIRFPEIPANCCLGGPDGQTLYATARTGVYSIKLNLKK